MCESMERNSIERKSLIPWNREFHGFALTYIHYTRPVITYMIKSSIFVNAQSQDPTHNTRSSQYHDYSRLVHASSYQSSQNTRPARQFAKIRDAPVQAVGPSMTRPRTTRPVLSRSVGHVAPQQLISADQCYLVSSQSCNEGPFV